MQVLEHEDGRLRARPGESPGDERSQLPSPHFLRLQVEVPIGRQRNVEQWGEQSRVLARLDPHQSQSAFQFGKALLGGHIGAAEPLASPFGDRMEGRVLEELRGAPFDPGMGRLSEPGMKLIDKPRLADAGFTDDLDELTLAASPLPAAREQAQLLFAADERRRRPPTRTPTDAAPANDAIETDRFRYIVEIMSAPLLGYE